MVRFVFVLIVMHFNYYQLTDGIHVLLDRFEQSLGQDIMWMDLRVRKYNRTSTVINGTVHLYQPASNDWQVRDCKKHVKHLLCLADNLDFLLFFTVSSGCFLQPPR